MLNLAGASSIATYQYYWEEPLYSINRSDKHISGVFRMVPMDPHGLSPQHRRLCVNAVRMAQVEPGRIPQFWQGESGGSSRTLGFDMT